MTTPKIDPATGHELGLPDPRPRPEILDELLASYQVNPKIDIYDIFYRLQTVVLDLREIVEREMAHRSKPAQRRK